MADDPKYRSADWLRGEIHDILDFYHPKCIDSTHGGYIAQLDEAEGQVYDRRSKHLVATARFIANFSVASQYDGPDWCADAARHGLEFLLTHQRDTEVGGFHWLLEGSRPVDSKRVCYGHAFAFLALARAVEAGVGDVEDELERSYELLMDRFWEPEYGLCKSEYDSDWTRPDEYRGQNANMHMCEAMIAAYEATDAPRYLETAMTIAESLTVDRTDATDGLVWEHYTSDWNHDFEYNRDDPNHTFRPWGYQPGHQIEWAKLLAILARYDDAPWFVSRAEDLFEAALVHGWNDDGGFYYSFTPSHEPLVTEKYSWEVAEAIGAACALYDRTEDEQYLEWYDRFWTYADANLINDRTRNWYTKVTAENQPVPTTAGVAVEPGYHPIGACIEGIRSLG